MNEEIISTLIQSILLIIFVTSFLSIIDKHAKINQAYYSHAKSLQTINRIISLGESFQEYCDYIFTNEINGIIRKNSETCQTRSSNYYSKSSEIFMTSLPVLKNNEIIWVGSYA